MKEKAPYPTTPAEGWRCEEQSAAVLSGPNPDYSRMTAGLSYATKGRDDLPRICFPNVRVLCGSACLGPAEMSKRGKPYRTQNGNKASCIYFIRNPAILKGNP